jgi:phosphomevalonate kinase
VLVCDPESCNPDQSPLERVEHTWNNYKELNVSPLSSKESLAKGIKLESVDDIPGLKDLLDNTLMI